MSASGLLVLLAAAGIVGTAAAAARAVISRRRSNEAPPAVYDLARLDTVRISPPLPARAVGSAAPGDPPRPVVRRVADVGPAFTGRTGVHVGVVVDDGADITGADVDAAGWPTDWPAPALCDQPHTHWRMPDDGEVTAQIFHATQWAFHEGRVLGPDGNPQHHTGLTGSQARVRWDDGLPTRIDSDAA